MIARREICQACISACVIALVLGCGQLHLPSSTEKSEQSTPPTTRAASTKINKRMAKYLPNVLQIHAKVISGGLPEDDDAFEELAQMGVKTVISVDGAKPDIATAKRFGLRYVHLPHGYDGITDKRVQELAKAVRDLEGSIYIHCHHGKHRSPTAAVVGCVSAGLITPSEAVPILTLAGTSPSYRGLYEAAENARPLGDALLDDLRVDFQERAELPQLAEAMVALEHAHDHVKKLSEAAWRATKEHPDLDSAHEILLLREQFTELLRSAEVQQYPLEFQELLRESEAAARELESGVRRLTAIEIEGNPPEMLSQLAERISNNCETCHQMFRDAPLSEKK